VWQLPARALANPGYPSCSNLDTVARVRNKEFYHRNIFFLHYQTLFLERETGEKYRTMNAKSHPGKNALMQAAQPIERLVSEVASTGFPKTVHDKKRIIK